MSVGHHLLDYGYKIKVRQVFNSDFYPRFATQSSTEEDTSYSPVNDKEKEDPQNGTYIGLTAKADPQA